jgi:hypothetical protein
MEAGPVLAGQGYRERVRKHEYRRVPLLKQAARNVVIPVLREVAHPIAERVAAQVNLAQAVRGTVAQESGGSAGGAAGRGAAR